MSDKKGHICRVVNIRKHPNADKLQLGECFNNQVVIGLDVRENELGIYFETDGRLSKEFLDANNLIGVVNPDGTRTGGFFDEKGKVRTQKFRKEKSDGYFCALSSVAYTGVDLSTLQEGTPFTTLNGHLICEKYVTERTKHVAGEKKKKAPKVHYPIFHEHIDTEQLAYNLDELKIGDILRISEKLHGTSQRTAHTLKVQQTWLGNLINSLFRRVVVEPKREWIYACGTRKVIIDVDNLQGFYGVNEGFRKTSHEKFVGKLHKGETVYYEVVGWQNKDTSLMPACENKKLGDKEFVKKYGKQTIFHYGCEPGATDVYVYRISMTNEDGVEIDLDWKSMLRRCHEMAVKYVPEIHTIILESKETLMQSMDKYVNRESYITPAHIMEGVVVRVDGSHWKALKYKSFNFKVLEGIIKDTGVADLEETA